MAALERATVQLRAQCLAHVALQLVDWRCLRPPDNIERDSVMRVAARAPNIEVQTPATAARIDAPYIVSRDLVPIL
jgi:hypothetical protein